MPYEDDYKMWLEEALIRMNPDWVCDEMSDNEFTHDWCFKYCGKDDVYITPKCLHMYYHHIARVDRKTENSSEKPNNSTISKMEQVDKDINVRSKDEPKGLCKICMNYPCGYWDEEFITHNHSVYECRAFEPKDEPQTERSSE